jgi:hypothetical protein
MSKMTCATTIRDQIGHKALFMLGADKLVGDEKSLTFSIKGCRTVNKIRITLTPLDLYDVEFLKVVMPTRFRDFSIETVALETGVYAEMLHAIIEKNTGLALSL